MKLIVGFYGTAFFAAGEYLKVVIDDNVGHYVEYIMSIKGNGIWYAEEYISSSEPLYDHERLIERYFFKKKWYHTIVYSFLLSLFFELTQLSGLYGIYPRPYRLFDVDDLLINTLGGLIGHIITPIFTIFLPTRDELEVKSYKKGQKVTLLRRVMSLIIDIFILSILSIVSRILFHNTRFEQYYAIITLFIYYILIPIFTSGKTFGKKVLRLKIAALVEKISWYHILFRNILLVFIIKYPYMWITPLNLSQDIEKRLWLVIIICQIINFLYYLITLPKEEHVFLYERISNTKNISTITDGLIPLPIVEEKVDNINKKNNKSNKKRGNNNNLKLKQENKKFITF